MDAPSGSMIAYATAPGMTASDGDGRNGVFTKNFLRAMDKNSGAELSEFMKQVAKGVQADTGKNQIPWISSSITGDFFFNLKPMNKKTVSVEAVPADGVKRTTIDEEEELWLAIKNSNSVEDFKDYIKTYPAGRFRKVADIKIRQLTEETRKPEPDKRVRIAEVKAPEARDTVLFSDSFVNNENSWPMWPKSDYYTTAIENGSYIMETKNTLNSAEFPGKFTQLPENFDIETTAIWKKGVNNYSYGLTMGTDAQNRYNFGLSGNGWTFISGYANNQVIDPAPMPWKSGTSIISNGYNQNAIRVQVRGTRFDYYVNNLLVGTVYVTLPRDRMRFGFFVENMQQVYFDNLKVTAY
jgi:hypothetical protein